MLDGMQHRQPADRAPRRSRQCGAATAVAEHRGRPRWKADLAQAFTDAETLLRFLDLDPTEPPTADGGAFGLLVPRGFAALMEPGRRDDPLLSQVLPRAKESRPAKGYGIDPVDDARARVAPGLLQKYAGRALLIANGACAVHCRYCFRRHFRYRDHAAGADLEPAIAALRASSQIHEILLSGGDPLLLDDTALEGLIGRLARIDHLRRLRIHTRVPVVLPSRVTDALPGLLGTTRLRPVVVLHANHPRELGDAAADAIERFARARLPLLNQSVLLRGVNDDLDTLAALAERLFDLGVTNYYLHQLDPVAGAAHFAVDDGRARTLLAGLRARLPGYLVPRLVREIPGAPSKVPLPP